MMFLKTLLIIALLTACGTRDDEYIWDRLTDTQKTAIQNAQSAQCLTATESLIETLKANSNSGLVGLSRGDYFTITEDSKTLDVVVLKYDSATESLFIFVSENENDLAAINEYPVFRENKDVVYKITLTQNSEQWEVIQAAMCTISTIDEDNEINNSYTDSTSNFNYTLDTSDSTGDDQEADIERFTFSNLVNNNLPAFFQFFNLVERNIERSETGTETEQSVVTYALARQTADFPDINETDFADRVEEADKCEYSSIQSYSSTDNTGIVVPVSNCDEEQYDIPDWYTKP